jgi:hypothetical protein
LQRLNEHCGSGEDNVGRERDQSRGNGATALDIGYAPADVEPHVTTFGSAHSSSRPRNAARFACVFGSLSLNCEATAMSRTRSPCCARAATGQAAAAPPRIVMNCRRLNAVLPKSLRTTPCGSKHSTSRHGGMGSWNGDYSRLRIAGQARCCRPVRRPSASPSIVLQKSFCTGDQKFCGLQVRLSCKDVRDLMA